MTDSMDKPDGSLVINAMGSQNAPDYEQTILVVDSDPHVFDVLSEQLEHGGFCLSWSVDGSAAFTYCNQVDSLPDIILVADTLPDMNGLDVCRHLLEQNSNLAVFMLINDVGNTIIDPFFEIGGIDIFYKPVHPRLVVRRIGQYLQARQTESLLEMRQRIQTVSEMAAVYLYEVSFPINGDSQLRWSIQGGTKSITGYEQEEIDVSQWLQLIHPDDLEEAQRHREILLAGKPHIAEFRIHTKDGQIRWLRDHGYPIMVQNEHRAAHICGVAQDITWCKSNEEKFHRQKVELEARNEELDAFAHSVAHDLKNPISSMMGFASLVKKYYDRMGDEAILEYLELIIDEGYQLKEMINSLLVLAGVNKMKDIELTSLDMPIIVSTVQRRLTSIIDETQATIITPEGWPEARGYAPWVEEVWMNYISNAVKYGGRPPVIEIGAEQAKENLVRFWVKDNGNGLTPEEQKNVFTPFTRLNQVNVEGHGLGLSVVQRIVRRLGGVIDVESKVGKGSIFSFTLPAQ